MLCVMCGIVIGGEYLEGTTDKRDRYVSIWIVELLASHYIHFMCSYKIHFVKTRINPTLSLIATIIYDTKFSQKDLGSMTEL